jgi:hypothetical protein
MRGKMTRATDRKKRLENQKMTENQCKKAIGRDFRDFPDFCTLPGFGNGKLSLLGRTAGVRYYPAQPTARTLP